MTTIRMFICSYSIAKLSYNLTRSCYLKIHLLSHIFLICVPSFLLSSPLFGSHTISLSSILMSTSMLLNVPVAGNSCNV